MAGASCSAEMLGQEGFGHENRAVVVVKLAFVRDKGDFDTFSLASSEVLFQRLQIAAEIAGAVELDGVDEDRNDNRSLVPDLFPGFSNEGEMPFMKGSHRWNEGKWAGKFLQRGPYRVDVWDTCDHLSQCR